MTKDTAELQPAATQAGEYDERQEIQSGTNKFLVRIIYVNYINYQSINCKRYSRNDSNRCNLLLLDSQSINGYAEDASCYKNLRAANSLCKDQSVQYDLPWSNAKLLMYGILLLIIASTGCHIVDIHF